MYEPTLRIESGETVLVETKDAFSGQIENSQDRLDAAAIAFSNPVTGPIYVEGAEKGDSLAVQIKEIKPTRGQGATRIPSWWGVSTGAGTSCLPRLSRRESSPWNRHAAGRSGENRIRRADSVA